jgi:hypothetical protein
MNNFLIKAALVTPVFALTLAVFAWMYTLYPCAGFYCAKDGKSFYTLDYSKVVEYNKTLR